MAGSLVTILLTAVCVRSLVVPGAPTSPRSPAVVTMVVATAGETTYALHDAAAAGDAGAVDLLLCAGLPCDDRNAKASTPLHVAALHGHEAVAAALLEHGADANAENEDGMRPLHAAAKARQLRVAQLLLSRGAEADATSNAGLRPISFAARQGDAAMLSALQEGGAEMDEATTQAAFWATVKAVDSTPEGMALSAEVPRLLRHVLDADMRQLLRREKITRNMTCLQPAAQGGVDGVSAGMSYIFDSDEHANLPLKPGRKCDDGACCEACSRNTFPTFATAAETDLATFPDLEAFNLNKCVDTDTATILNFVRLIERVRRTIAHEYGLPLAGVLPLQAYSRKYVAGTKQQGGGGGEGAYVILHTDEATHSSYHYSCVLYLSTQGEDFDGGSFLWNDPAAEGGGRVVTPFAPQRGAAVIFSSGWENMHEVEPLSAGVRYAVPCFFTTELPPPGALESMGGAPSGDEAIADALQSLLLDPERENPLESVGRVKELLMKWHLLLAPEHA